ncbi:MAG: CaiB/BaiF CoA-transferase family protein [Pseudomonadales bacterium]|jgi:crotonobetainyl-CoA:carnitine CoA-transferase CaiB-like acyl-CoA transferase|nr:CaiB/BaiF CoA-transferase family protein [Pseudomonadales bacterium]MDP7596228.1 CaiB/BaiF CoA-transferase family protein [Pseudomonadales bacterium]HJN49454.1 CaiB/BaiF CoA-transferase family protein [Pseudomonadales bacterium]
MPGPLAGIRVIDLTNIYSGPICTSILGDQGADIIKVESLEGDWMRAPRGIQRNGVSGAFAMMNRNKRSIVIDLTTVEGKAVLRKLVADADVLVENFRPGVMERLGIGYDVLKQVNEGLIFASINGVGHAGPYSGRRVYDAIIQSISGIGSLQADPNTDRPLLVNSLICDKLTSMTAAQSISSALVARERTGIGQRVDIAMLESALFFLWSDNMLNFTFVGDDFPYAFHPSHANMIRQTKDGYVCTMPVQSDEWQGLFRALDLPNLVEEERFQTDDGIDMVLFQAALNEAYARFTTDELLRRLEENQVPFATVNAREEVIDDPQVVAMQSLWEFEHPIAGEMRQARPPARFSETPAGIFRCSPEHGEHTREVLEEAGYSSEEISAMRVRNIVR